MRRRLHIGLSHRERGPGFLAGQWAWPEWRTTKAKGQASWQTTQFVEDADPALNDQIDAAYRTKYRRYAKSIIDSVLTPQARAATLKLVPRS